MPSKRTYAALVTLIGLASFFLLGISACYLAMIMHNEKTSINSIVSKGGIVVYLDDEMRWGDVRSAYGFASALMHGERVVVILTGTTVDSEMIDAISNLRGVEALTLGKSAVSDGDLLKFMPLEQLTQLDLHATSITDQNTHVFRTLTKLTNLDLSHTQITDKTLEHISKCPNLLRLNLKGTQISDEGLRFLSHSSNLQWLNISDTSVTDVGKMHVLKMRQLSVLIAKKMKSSIESPSKHQSH